MSLAEIEPDATGLPPLWILTVAGLFIIAYTLLVAVASYRVGRADRAERRADKAAARARVLLAEQLRVNTKPADNPMTPLPEQYQVVERGHELVRELVAEQTYDGRHAKPDLLRRDDVLRWPANGGAQ